MPFDYSAVVKKKYQVRPVTRSLIPTNHGAKQQVLWVGCSDSLILETEALGVHPDEIFVHRNLGNILSNGDLSSASAVEYSLENLKVDHIVICGHYDCDLIHPTDTIGEKWYKDVSKLHDINERHMSTSPGMTNLDEASRDCRLEEVYVLAEVDWIKKQANVKNAMEERGLKVHAFCYDRERNSCSELVEREETSGPVLKDPWAQPIQERVLISVS